MACVLKLSFKLCKVKAACSANVDWKKIQSYCHWLRSNLFFWNLATVYVRNNQVLPKGGTGWWYQEIINWNVFFYIFWLQENKIRITLLSRKTKYRNILNEDEVWIYILFGKDVDCGCSKFHFFYVNNINFLIFWFGFFWWFRVDQKDYLYDLLYCISSLWKPWKLWENLKLKL